MFTTVIEIVRRNPGLTISRNAATYEEYHRGLFQMLPGFWRGLYSSYRYIFFSSNMEWSPSLLVRKVYAVFRKAHHVTLSWARWIRLHVFFLYFLAFAVWWRCQYWDYTALVVGWLMNICQLVEWELARESEVSFIPCSSKKSLILFSHICLGLSSDLFSSGLLTKICVCLIKHKDNFYFLPFIHKEVGWEDVD